MVRQGLFLQEDAHRLRHAAMNRTEGMCPVFSDNTMRLAAPCVVLPDMPTIKKGRIVQHTGPWFVFIRHSAD